MSHDLPGTPGIVSAVVDGGSGGLTSILGVLGETLSTRSDNFFVFMETDHFGAGGPEWNRRCLSPFPIERISWGTVFSARIVCFPTFGEKYDFLRPTVLGMNNSLSKLDWIPI